MIALADGGVAAEFGIASLVTSLLVALLAIVFAALAFAAMKRRGNRALVWVGVAFLVFAGKNLFSAANVTTHIVPHDEIELALSLFDLGIILLLFFPFLVRKR